MPKTINSAIETVPLSLLKPHPKNVNQGDFGAIQQSIETNGFYGTIVANKRTGHILAGNHRYHVAKQSGFDSLPVAWVDVDDEEEIRILLADNRTTRLGQDDESKLAELLAELANTEKGLSGTGFDGDDLDRLIGDLAGPNFDPATLDEQGRLDQKKPVTCPECGHEFHPKD
jgi:ParB-like chromosome segregation protein Spo0J